MKEPSFYEMLNRRAINAVIKSIHCIRKICSKPRDLNSEQPSATIEEVLLKLNRCSTYYHLFRRQLKCCLRSLTTTFDHNNH